MNLQDFWFLFVALLFIGYFLLEGFDFGVGMLMPFLPRTVARRHSVAETSTVRNEEVERRVLLNTIGPVWDGNEVWVITGAGAMFAAFPQWYATIFSGFYFPLLVLLFGLIVRVVAIEWRGKIEDPRWKNWCDVGIGMGSWLPAILWGFIFTSIVIGVPLDASGYVSGSIVDLFQPVAILGGVTTCILFLFHGSVFVSLKTEGVIREEARNYALRFAPVAIVLVVLTSLGIGWLRALRFHSSILLASGVAVVAVISLCAAVFALRSVREGWSFAFTGIAVVAVSVLLFGSLYPQLVTSWPHPEHSVSLAGSASNPYTLTVMAWASLATVPFVLAYQAWSYWVFRQRISTAQIPHSIGLSLRITHSETCPARSSGAQGESS